MTPRRALLPLAWALVSAATTFAELAVSDLEQLGPTVSSNVQGERVRLLKGLRLPATKNSDPTFAELIELVNKQLNAKKAAFHIAVHVNKRASAWWEAAKKMTLSESYEMRSADAKKRSEYLQAASAWDIVNLVSLSWGTPDPLFFKSAIILSPEVGSLPTTLKEHQPERRESAK